MSHRWLVLRLEAPLMAFGAVSVDQAGPTRRFPGASMLTGLLANALGWHWSDRVAHQTLQDRLVFAVRSERTGSFLTDVQNAQLSKADTAWTTAGEPGGRAGASYAAPHRRSRDYIEDQSSQVVLRLDPADESPTLTQLADSIDRPSRPLYIGRKPCLPSCRLMNGWVTSDTAHGALSALAGSGAYQAVWPVSEGPASGEQVDRVMQLPDLRNWLTGLHSGSRDVVEGRVYGMAQE